MLRQRADFEAGKMGEVYSLEAHYHANHDYIFAKHKNQPPTNHSMAA